MQYLGHIHSTPGIKPLPSITAAIKLMNAPKNVKQVRTFLGLVGYHYKFIKNFAHIAKPLIAITHHDAKFAWTLSHLTAFNTLKSTLLEAPILHYPDPSKCYIVYTDASDNACHRNMMVKNFQLHFSPSCSLAPNRNGALWDRKPTTFTMS